MCTKFNIYNKLLLFLLIGQVSCTDSKVSILEARNLCLKEVESGQLSAMVIDHECLNGYYVDELKGTSVSGESINIGDSNHKAYVINTWFPECLPCVEEIPYLINLQEEFGSSKQSVNFVGLCKCNIAEESNFIEQHQYYYHHLLEGDKILKNYLPESGFPLTYIVDYRGKIVGTFRKITSENYDEIKLLIYSLINEDSLGVSK